MNNKQLLLGALLGVNVTVVTTTFLIHKLSREPKIKHIYKIEDFAFAAVIETKDDTGLTYEYLIASSEEDLERDIQYYLNYYKYACECDHVRLLKNKELKRLLNKVF